MPLLSLLKTTTFRLALVYLTLFAVSAFALLGFVYWNTAGFMARQTDQTLEAEITGLQEQFDRRGFNGLLEIVAERSRESQDSLYLLTDAARRPLAGNLRNWPDTADQSGVWIDFTIATQNAQGTESHPVRARLFIIRNRIGSTSGYLLVGRDVSDRRQIERMITGAIYWATALTLALGLAGGVVMSRNMMRRLEPINRTSRRIMEGDLSRRMPITGYGDEMDQLSENLNAMLDEIERLMTAMRQVTDNIAHDLRSPLNRLRTRIEVTLMRQPDVTEFQRVLEETVVEADDLLATFSALLDIARIEAGTSRSQLTDLDPAELVNDIAELYEPVCDAAGHKLNVRLSTGLRIQGNRELLSRALSNLLDNAVKYSDEGREILLALGKNHSDQVEIEVSDRGPGIPVADRARVQDRFVRLEGSRSKPGSGLGLSLVAAVARLHGATLELGDRPDGASGLSARLVFPSFVKMG